MSRTPRFTRRARWAVPSGAVAAVGVVVAGSVLTSALAAPALRPRTPAQLIAAIAANRSVPASLSGTIVSDAALGLPALPGLGSPASIASLLTGSHTIQVWYAKPAQLRIALPVPLGESDLRVNGRQIWLWDSKTNTATHIVGPGGPSVAAPGPGASWSSSTGQAPSSATSTSASTAYQSSEVISAPTPQQLASQLLAAVGPTTTVGVQSNVTVAGRAAYQLTLAPKNPGSLIGRVSIAVDASRYIPLRVQVFAHGASSPAYQVGFTAISFARPAASNFAFTPPPGAKVKISRQTIGPLAAGLPGNNGGGVILAPESMITCPGIRANLNGKPTGRRMSSAKCARIISSAKCARIISSAVPLPTGSLTMSPLRAVLNSVRIGLHRPLTRSQRLQLVMGGMPKHLSASQRQHLLQMLRRQMPHFRRLHPGFGRHGSGWYGYAPMSGATFSPGMASAPRVIGSGWVSVGVFPAPGLPAGPAGGVAGAMLRSATLVHGSWGSGRLLRTSLLSVLITNDGTLLIGAVTPSVLYAAAAQAK
jgi:outer membrane lipoprotein-sorting protein